MAKIQVILLEDVAGQGRKGDIVTVSDGYAHNFLIKGNKGVLASPEELNKIESKRKKEEKKNLEEKNKALDLKKLLESKKIKMEVKIGENGKLFGAITNKEASQAIEKEFNVTIDRKKIDCNIKSLGEHKIIVKLHTDVKAELTVMTVGN
ncbi:50S ribosomal protein L9 [Fusobacterium sp. PH5-44]|uniref:50S ribosomal protein L9 n=1 Tax=unclassified Fusobacterium TaxID=2648384 RepID=UPI003D198DEF